ncbi:MAG: hypothetical protein OXT09_18135 [Myxococcales bacterium]|nr:hypothetical protein [Myxococcales bacterium]
MWSPFPNRLGAPAKRAHRRPPKLTRGRGSAQELRLHFTELLAAGDNEEAAALIPQLRMLEPMDARWPHKHGDLLRAAGRAEEAADAYVEAARLYAEGGLSNRAMAMRTLASSLQSRLPPHEHLPQARQPSSDGMREQP